MKLHIFNIKLSVRIVTVVLQRVNYCVKCAGGGPSTGSGVESCGWVQPRSCFSKHLLNCLNISTLTAEMVKRTNLQSLKKPQNVHLVLMCSWTLRGQMIVIAMLAVAQLTLGHSVPDRSKVKTQKKVIPWSTILGLGDGLKTK